MYVINKPKATGKHYIKLYYKTLGENHEHYEYSKGKQDVEVITSSGGRHTA